MWCNIKNTQYAKNLKDQIGERNAKAFSIAVQRPKFKQWFGNGKTVKTEDGYDVPFVNPILQVINEKNEKYNLLKRYPLKSISDAKRLFNRPGISGDSIYTQRIDEGPNYHMNHALIDQVEEIYPGLVIKDGDFFGLNQMYNFIKTEDWQPAADYETELIEEAKTYIDDIKGMYRGLVTEENIEHSLFEAAQQANNSDSEREGAIKIFGERFVAIAQNLYPDVQIGDKFKEPKTDKNLAEKLNSFSLYDDYTKICSEGICNYTAAKSTEYLESLGLDPFPQWLGSSIAITVKSPVGPFDISHYVSLVAINDTLYIYDMPQNEFISEDFYGIGDGVDLKQTFKPRLIPVTADEIAANYNINIHEAGNVIKSILRVNVNNHTVTAYIKKHINNPQEYLEQLQNEVDNFAFERSESMDEWRAKQQKQKDKTLSKRITNEQEERLARFYENKIKMKTREYVPTKTDRFSLNTLIKNVIGRIPDSAVNMTSFETALASFEEYVKSDRFVDDMYNNYKLAKDSNDSIQKEIDGVYSTIRFMGGFLKNARIEGIDKAISRYDKEQKYRIRSLLPRNTKTSGKSEKQVIRNLARYFSNKDSVVKALNAGMSKDYKELMLKSFKARNQFLKAETVLNFIKATEGNTSFLSDAITAEAKRRYKYFEKKGTPMYQKMDTDTDRAYIREMNMEDSKLKLLLDKLSTRFNVPYRLVNDPTIAEKAWFGEDGVFINQAYMKADTAFHEFLHPFILVLEQQNPALYKALIKQLYAEGQDSIEYVNNKYPELSQKDKDHEALVTYLGRLTAEQRAESSLIQRFLKWLKNLFKKIHIIDFEALSLDTTLKDISDLIQDDTAVANLTGAMRGGTLLKRYQKPDTDITYAAVFEKLQDRVAILYATVERRKRGEQFKQDVSVLNDILQNKDEITSIGKFVENANHYVDIANKRFESLRNSVINSAQLTPEQISENLHTLSEIQQLLNVYEALNDINALFLKEGRKLDDPKVIELNETIRLHAKTALDFKPFALTYITEWLYPYIEITNKNLIAQGKQADVLTKEGFREQLSMALRDINTASAWLGASINSGDPISAAVGLALKDVIYTNHVKNIAVKDDLAKAYKDARGSKAYTTKKNEEEFNLQYLREAEFYEQTGEDKEGNPIMEYVKRLAFHTEYLDDQFEKERKVFFDRIGTAPAKDSPAYKKWSKQVSEWYSENVVKNPDFYDIVMRKKAQLSPKAFQDWVNANTKEVEEEYYEWIGTRKSDYYGQKGVLFDRNEKKGTFRIFAGELLLPAAKWRNPQFAVKMQDPYYRKIYGQYKEANEQLGYFGLKYGLIPQVTKGKNLFSDLSWKKSVKDNLRSIGGNIVDSIEADPESEWSIERQDGTKVKHIPIHYTRKLKIEDLDVNLVESVLKFTQMSNNYDGLAEIEPNILILKTLMNGDMNLKIKGRQIAQTNAKGKTVFNRIIKKVMPKASDQGRLNQRLNEFIDDVFYGDDMIKDSVTILGKEISVNKLADKAGFFTSLSIMALNFTGGINNVIIGNYNNLLEAIGARFFSGKDYAWAKKEYWKLIPSSIGELVGREKSLLAHLGEHYDVPQGEFMNQFGEKISGGQVNKLMTSSSLFFAQQGGEHEIQYSGMLALMRATKTTTLEGKEVTLYEAWEQKADGSFGIKEGVNWSEAQDKEFRNRLHAVTKSINGVYNKFDKAMLQRRWYGKLALMFRKYMFMAFKNRYGSKYIDYELGTTNEGYWRLFCKKMYSEAKEYKWHMFANMWTKEGYSEDQKAAINKTLLEVSIMIAAMILAGMKGDDDDDSWLTAETALQITRMSSDISQFISPLDFIRVVRNPAASINVLEKWIGWFGQLVFNPFEEYERASGIAKKGDSKLYIKTLKVLPGVRGIINFATPEEQIKFYNLFSITK